MDIDLTAAAPLANVMWDKLWWSNDYVNVTHFGECIHSGDALQISSSSGGPLLYNITSQHERAEAMIGQMSTKRSLRGHDGKHFVIGFEHWGVSASLFATRDVFSSLALRRHFCAVLVAAARSTAQQLA